MKQFRNKIKKNIKALVVICFYKHKFNEPILWGKNKGGIEVNRWSFKMHPRKFNIWIVLTLLTPIIILFGGIKALKECFKDSLKIQSWSSYDSVLPVGEKPKWFDCYRKF